MSPLSSSSELRDVMTWVAPLSCVLTSFIVPAISETRFILFLALISFYLFFQTKLDNDLGEKMRIQSFLYLAMVLGWFLYSGIFHEVGGVMVLDRGNNRIMYLKENDKIELGISIGHMIIPVLIWKLNAFRHIFALVEFVLIVLYPFNLTHQLAFSHIYTILTLFLVVFILETAQGHLLEVEKSYLHLFAITLPIFRSTPPILFGFYCAFTCSIATWALYSNSHRIITNSISRTKSQQQEKDIEAPEVEEKVRVEQKPQEPQEEVKRYHEPEKKRAMPKKRPEVAGKRIVSERRGVRGSRPRIYKEPQKLLKKQAKPEQKKFTVDLDN